jgi:selenocysteine lyase/cysteine desulfurase
MGLSLVYWGLALQPGDELLITTHDHFVHHESMRLAAQRSGATVRKVALYDRFDDLPAITEEKIVERIRAAIGPKTRAVGLTWVHSSSGLRLPVRAIATAIRQRAPNALIVLDGVHGLGAVDETVAEMDIDIFVSGTHKWIFGSRGTGLIWSPERVWAQLHPVVPTFDSMVPEDAWMAEKEPAGPPRADWFTPGGFHTFEHEWAVAEAFEFHRTIGRRRIATRIAVLNGLLKDGLAGMRHVKLWTPRSPTLSAGLVGFDVLGMDADTVRDQLWEQKIVATARPYTRRVVRFAAGIMNNEEDVEQALRAVTRLA